MLNTPMRTENEILVSENALDTILRSVDAEKFISLLQRESFDYTEWQKTLWSGLSVKKISKMAMDNLKKKKQNE